MSTAAEVVPMPPAPTGIASTRLPSATSSPPAPTLPPPSRSPLPSPYSRTESPRHTHDFRTSRPESRDQQLSQVHRSPQDRHPPPHSPLPPSGHSPRPYPSNNSPPSDHGRLQFFSHQHHQRAPPLLHPADHSSAIPRALPPMSSVIRGTSPRSMSLALSESQAAVDALNADQTAPRKRSKVSRACDECRRKKIRCDATSESGVEHCSSCRRVGTKCQFSRVPMKRGPSKGYIKELAERLNTLENSMSTGELHSYGGEGDMSPGNSETTSPPPGIGGLRTRKRTLSSSSDYRREFHQTGIHLQPLSQTRSSTGEHNQINRLPPIESFHSSHPQKLPEIPRQQIPHMQQHQQQRSSFLNSNSETHHQRYSSVSPDHKRNSYWNHPETGPPPLRRSSADDVSQVQPRAPSEPAHVPEISSPELNVHFDWDERCIDRYYATIHPLFPLLPHSKNRLHSRLTSSPPLIRDALLSALSAVTTPPSPSSPYPTSSARKAAELCLRAQYESSLTPSSKLLLLQTTLLLALETDNHGPSSTSTRQPGPGKGIWLATALALAQDLKLRQPILPQHQPQNLDADEAIGRRVWWILVVLDRWRAISTGSSAVVAEGTAGELVDGDQDVLGTELWEMARLNIIVNHISLSLSAPTQQIPIITSLLRGELTLWRTTAAQNFSTHPVLESAYHHISLLCQRLSPPKHSLPSQAANQYLEQTAKIVEILENQRRLGTLVDHHFYILVLSTIEGVIVTGTEETKKEAGEIAKRVVTVLERVEGAWGEGLREWADSVLRQVTDRISKEKPKETGQKGGSPEEEKENTEFWTRSARRLAEQGYLGAASF